MILEDCNVSFPTRPAGVGGLEHVFPFALERLFARHDFVHAGAAWVSRSTKKLNHLWAITMCIADILCLSRIT